MEDFHIPSGVETPSFPEPRAIPQEHVGPNPYFTPLAIIIAGVLIAGAVLYANDKIPSVRLPAQAGGAVAMGNAGDKNLEGDDPILGNPEAPVAIVEFGDFQCPFCKRFFDTTEKKIIDTYVKTGKAKLIYRDFPLTSIHEWAQKTAEASECADEQGKFWPYHDLLYQRQDMFSITNLKTWAREIGLDGARFNQCLDSGKYAKEVEEDLAAGQAAGVNGTPATFINGRLIAGAVPFAQFQAIIEEELKKTGK